MFPLSVNALVSAAVVGLTLSRGTGLAGTVPIVLISLASVTLSIVAVFSDRARTLLLATAMTLAVMTLLFSPGVATDVVLSVAVTMSFIAGISQEHPGRRDHAVISQRSNTRV